MKLTKRDKILATLLPTIVVVIVYGLFFLRGKVAELDRVAKSLKDAAAKAPSQALIGAQQLEMAKAKRESDAMDNRLNSLQKQWNQEAAFCVSGPSRHDRVQKLTFLMNKYHLDSLEDSEVTTATKEGKVSPSLESVADKIAQLPGGQKPQLRRIRFHGRYSDVNRVLDELANGERLAIPVGLTMKATEDIDRREWTLLLWL